MREIILSLPHVKQKVLTSATQEIDIPSFVSLQNPKYINNLSERNEQLKIYRVVSPVKDKLSTLYATLCALGDQSGIVFTNFKDSIERVRAFLRRHNIAHSCFHGGMEQRERAFIDYVSEMEHIVSFWLRIWLLVGLMCLRLVLLYTIIFPIEKVNSFIAMDAQRECVQEERICSPLERRCFA